MSLLRSSTNRRTQIFFQPSEGRFKGVVVNSQKCLQLYNKDWIPESNPLAPFLYKRKSFQHEHEVRALIPMGDLRELQKDPHLNSVPLTGLWQTVDLKCLVEKVYVAPDAPTWFFELVKRVTERYEQASIAVVQSLLSATPFY